ncbi:hypothetical protein [Dyella nitratireducens]|uniref:Uncharacterized protein n=1 Tax=Dyella nitratireducens TaxID=1849580 RepID=A0ABQ1GVW5_9GAMM|nr:hypothetical protein [Dyella nitratireducens]GGA51344.1 hypothetical protein GCM10010981_45920 [Dyella nitratireducens]GLQ41715.1 hypothetical protein GCM10007902_15650 [Dyella nitratireducens]
MSQRLHKWLSLTKTVTSTLHEHKMTSDQKQVLKVRDAHGDTLDAHIERREKSTIHVQLVIPNGPTHENRFTRMSDDKLVSAIERWMKREWICARQ